MVILIADHKLSPNIVVQVLGNCTSDADHLISHVYFFRAVGLLKPLNTNHCNSPRDH